MTVVCLIVIVFVACHSNSLFSTPENHGRISFCILCYIEKLAYRVTVNNLQLFIKSNTSEYFV